MNSRGQSTLEFLFAMTTTLIVSGIAVIFTLQFIFLSTFCRYYLYQFLICKQKALIVQPCELTIRNKIKNTIIHSKIFDLKYNQTKSKASARLQVHILNKIPMDIYEEILLPLQ